MYVCVKCHAEAEKIEGERTHAHTRYALSPETCEVCQASTQCWDCIVWSGLNWPWPQSVDICTKCHTVLLTSVLPGQFHKHPSGHQANCHYCGKRRVCYLCSRFLGVSIGPRYTREQILEMFVLES